MSRTRPGIGGLTPPVKSLLPIGKRLEMLELGMVAYAIRPRFVASLGVIKRLHRVLDWALIVGSPVCHFRGSSSRVLAAILKSKLEPPILNWILTGTSPHTRVVRGFRASSKHRRLLQTTFDTASMIISIISTRLTDTSEWRCLYNCHNSKVGY